MNIIEVPKDTPTRETDDTTNNMRRSWHCVACKLPLTSPEQLAVHMIRDHWEDNWTLKMENTPLELKIAMKGPNNQAQAKNTGTIVKDTKRAMEVGTEDATETTVKKAKVVETTVETANSANTRNDENPCAENQTEEEEKKPTHPDKTLKETLEAQRETMDRTTNFKTKSPRNAKRKSKRQKKRPKAGT